MIVIFYPLCIRERIDELLRECGIVSHDKVKHTMGMSRFRLKRS